MKKLKSLFLSLLLWVYPLRSEPINEGAYILEEIGDVLRFCLFCRHGQFGDA